MICVIDDDLFFRLLISLCSPLLMYLQCHGIRRGLLLPQLQDRRVMTFYTT